jgi:hypothetical protein
MLEEPFLTSLLYEDEGPELDFKEQQYRFYGGASDTDKAELLKDILSFSNAWRRSDAYILIGVQERTGSKAVVVGVRDHLKDADLQQFVNSKTNTPVEFYYSSSELEGKSVGVIRVPKQERPRFLTKAYGGLQPNTVYLRRGSSTAAATPDEIIKMGLATHAALSSPSLSVVFADADKRVALGDTIDMQCLLIDIQNRLTLPDYTESHNSYFTSSTFSTNPNYYRELAWHTIVTNLVRPLQFAIRNDGAVSATDVHVELLIRCQSAFVFDEDSLPRKPEPRHYGLLKGYMPRLRRDAPDVAVKELTDSWVVDLSVQKVHPGSTSWLRNTLYVGAKTSHDLVLAGRLSADNVSPPQLISLAIKCSTESKSMSLSDVIRLERERQEADA